MKETNNIIATKICKNNKDKKHLNHVLKNTLVLLLHRHKIAKGERTTSTFIRIYRMEYETLRFKKPNKMEAFKIPVKAK